MQKQKKSLSAKELSKALSCKNEVHANIRFLGNRVEFNKHLLFWDGVPPEEQEGVEPKGYMFTLRVSKFPDCCGLTCVSGFYGLSQCNASARETLLLMAEDVIRKSQRVGGLIATTSEADQKDIEEILLVCGWKIVGSLGNPNSGHVVHTFFKQLVDPKDTDEYQFGDDYDDD